MWKTATARNIFMLILISVLATIFTAVSLFMVSQRELRARSLAEMTYAAQASAGTIQTSLSSAAALGKNARAAMMSMVAKGMPNRNEVNNLLKALLEANPMLVGISSSWEPNAFDGRDAAFVGVPGHDQTGRFIPYFGHSNGEIIHEPLVGYDKPGEGDYYLVPKRTGKDMLTEPYFYKINGKDVLMTSVMVVLKKNDVFVGTIGVDVALDELARAFADLKPYGTGFATLISPQGMIASHPNAEFLGKSVADAVPAWKDMLDGAIGSSEYTDENGKTHLAVSIPVEMVGAPWRIIVSAPTTSVYESLSALVTAATIIIVGAVLLLGITGFWQARRLVRRIAGIVALTRQVADGQTDIDLAEAKSRDEIGDMARSLETLRDATVSKLKLQAEAEQLREISDAERRERRAAEAQNAEELQTAMRALAAGLDNLSKGNLLYRIATPFAVRLDQLRTDFNQAIERLHTTLKAVGDNASAIDAGAREIRHASDELSRRTEQQAASVEETAATLEEITATVRISATRAEDVGRLVERTRDGAARSGVIVGNAVDAMTAISTSSGEISNIIGLIDDIAFQTNLLALNAGVEAARAGDAGRGFAVVAQEVRELAQRSANAAKEIKALITKSGEHVRTGVTLVGETGQALDTIAREVSDIDRNVSAIVMAAREQAVALREISAAINTMDQGTQQNAAMAEEQTAASHGLASEAMALAQLLEQFQLEAPDAVRRRVV